MSSDANFPAGSPLDAAGNLTPQWRMFFLTLFNRSGGTSGNDTAALQTQLKAAIASITDLQTEGEAGFTTADLAPVYALICAVDAIAAQAMAAAARVHDERAEFGEASAYGDLLSRFRSLESHIHGASGDRALSTQDIDAQLAAGAFVPTDTAHLTNSAGFVTTQAGRLLAVRSLASGVYNKTAGANTVLVRMQAPGGAGGGTPATGAGQSAAAGGASAGAYVEALFAASVLDGLTVSLGSIGLGVAGAAGGSATAATFGSALSLPGGFGGSLASALSAPGFTGGSGITAAPTVTGALATLLAIPGYGGDAGFVYAAGSLSSGGRGANSPVGFGSQPKPGLGSNAGTGYGFGGGGANAGASQAAQAGANGGAGWCEVWEFS